MNQFQGASLQHPVHFVHKSLSLCRPQAVGRELYGLPSHRWKVVKWTRITGVEDLHRPSLCSGTTPLKSMPPQNTSHLWLRRRQGIFKTSSPSGACWRKKKSWNLRKRQRRTPTRRLPEWLMVGAFRRQWLFCRLRKLQSLGRLLIKLVLHDGIRNSFVMKHSAGFDSSLFYSVRREKIH